MKYLLILLVGVAFATSGVADDKAEIERLKKEIEELKANQAMERLRAEAAELMAMRVVNLNQLQTKKDGKYFQGRLFTGMAIARAESGRLTSEITFKRGKKHGWEKQWYATGVKWLEGSYINGEKNGISTSYYSNGQKAHLANYLNGKVSGKKTGWYRGGQKRYEKVYKSGAILTWKVWKPNGKECEKSLINGGEGLFVEYLQDGSKSKETPYLRGKVHGTEITYNSYGRVSSKTPYVDGKWHGTAISYFRNGSRSSETPYVEGLLHGNQIQYVANPFLKGTKKKVTPFVNGKKHGTEIEYNEDESKKTEIVYENNKVISRKRF